MNAGIKAYTLSQCMESMAQYAESYEKLGGENIIFCEDRLTLLAERALVARLGGTFHSSVSTFARFVKAEGKTVSKQGSVMMVGGVMARLQREGKLQCFTSSAGIAKNARSIYETLAQFSASEITPDVLKQSLSLLPEGTLKKKVSDFAYIFEELDADAVSAGLQDELVLLDIDNNTGDTADGGDIIAGLDGRAHLLCFLLALVLGTDQHEVHQAHHHDQHDHGAAHAASGGSGEEIKHEHNSFGF